MLCLYIKKEDHYFKVQFIKMLTLKIFVSHNFAQVFCYPILALNQIII